MTNIPCNWDAKHVPCQQIRGNSFGLPSPAPEWKHTLHRQSSYTMMRKDKKVFKGKKYGTVNVNSSNCISNFPMPNTIIKEQKFT